MSKDAAFITIIVIAAFISVIVLLYIYGQRVSTQMTVNNAQVLSANARLMSVNAQRSSAKSRQHSEQPKSVPQAQLRSESALSPSPYDPLAKHFQIYQHNLQREYRLKDPSIQKAFKTKSIKCMSDDHAQPESKYSSVGIRTTKAYQPHPADLNSPLFDTTTSSATFRVAILIGINYVKDPYNRLATCFHDIEGMARWILTLPGWNASNLVVLTDVSSPSDVFSPSMLRRPATMSELDKVWSSVHANASRAIKSEIIWVYSGHGTTQLNLDDTELDGQDEYIVMTDGLVRDDDIYTRYLRPLPPTCSAMVFMDACHSHTILDLPYSYNRLGNDIQQESPYTDVQARIVCFSGCRDEQTSQAGASSREFSALTKQVLRNVDSMNGQPCKQWYESLRTSCMGQYSQIPMMTCSHTNLYDAVMLR